MTRLLKSAAKKLLLNPKECSIVETLHIQSSNTTFVRLFRFGQIYETYVVLD